MTKPEHTPTPWFRDNDAADSFETTYGSVYGANGDEVMSFGAAVQYYPIAGEPPSEADEKFMLRAVNSFELMLEALRAVRNTDDHADPAVRALVRAALAQAEAA